MLKPEIYVSERELGYNMGVKSGAQWAISQTIKQLDDILDKLGTGIGLYGAETLKALKKAMQEWQDEIRKIPD